MFAATLLTFSSVQSSSSNEVNNWVTILSSVINLANWVALSAKYLQFPDLLDGQLWSPSGRVCRPLASCCLQTTLAVTRDPRMVKTPSLQSSSSLQSRKAGSWMTGALWDGADPTLHRPSPRVLPWRWCARKTSAYPSRCEDRPFLLIITKKKREDCFCAVPINKELERSRH